jgi:hypothetical protein
MLKILTLISSLIFIGQVEAAETLLKHDEIILLLTDVVLHSQSDGQPADQIFQKSGSTFYSVGGSQSQGTWFVQADQYCSTWPPNPTPACYDVTRDSDKVTFISKSGKRFEALLTK